MRNKTRFALLASLFILTPSVVIHASDSPMPKIDSVVKGSDLVLTGGGWVVKPSPWPGHSGLNIPNAICQPQVREAMAGLICRIARTSFMNLKLHKIGLTPLQ